MAGFYYPGVFEGQKGLEFFAERILTLKTARKNCFMELQFYKIRPLFIARGLAFRVS